MSIIVDEGGKMALRLSRTQAQLHPGGYSDLSGTVFATPAVAEKGYLDVRVDVLTPGGHSSRPPKHTVRMPLYTQRDVS